MNVTFYFHHTVDTLRKPKMRRATLPRNLLLAATSAMMVCAGSAGASAGGLFDFLFGSRPAPVAPAYQPDYYYGGNAITVGPRYGGEEHAHRRMAARSVSKKPENTAIDPVKVPNWYLQDPTLRRGDIVVLKTGVLVFNGSDGDTANRSDFSSLKQSRLVSAKTKDLLARSAVSRDNDIAAIDPTAPAALASR